ncbi:MAG: preprotein translocase subunit SecE [Gammaproteobacteria bacterium]|nr:preprotein translocase subunit SecE [Gammaproteobacteria bacterium]
MAANADTSERLDPVKWALAFALVGGAIWAFYYFGDHSLLLRVVGMLAATAAALAVIVQTRKGHMAWEFVLEARTEVRKVVWPTRKETVHTTGIIMLMVTVVAIFLWLLDMFLAWAIRAIIGGA